jgi:hypothetical protein
MTQTSIMIAPETWSIPSPSEAQSRRTISVLIISAGTEMDTSGALI